MMHVAIEEGRRKLHESSTPEFGLYSRIYKWLPWSSPLLPVGVFWTHALWSP